MLSIVAENESEETPDRQAAKLKTVTETFELGSFRTDDREEAIGALVSAETFRDPSKSDVSPRLTD